MLRGQRCRQPLVKLMRNVSDKHAAVDPDHGSSNKKQEREVAPSRCARQQHRQHSRASVAVRGKAATQLAGRRMGGPLHKPEKGVKQTKKA